MYRAVAKILPAQLGVLRRQFIAEHDVMLALLTLDVHRDRRPNLRLRRLLRSAMLLDKLTGDLLEVQRSLSLQ